METVKIDIISDLHLDFYFNETKQKKEEVYLKTLDIWFKDKKSYILVIAGDLGHYNAQTEKIVKIIQKNYYKNVVCVLGNHDYYLLSKRQRNIYLNDSMNKVRNLRERLNALDGVYCLNGNVIVIDGVRIGGCDSWYDAKVWNVDDKNEIVDLWKSTMNDANMIKGIDNFYDLVAIEQKKMKRCFNKCDVMVTHISPSIDKENIPQYKKDEKLEGFYTFDGDQHLYYGNMQYWIFGHMHKPLEYEKYGTVCVSNPFGYPKQSKDFKIKTIEVKPRKEFKAVLYTKKEFDVYSHSFEDLKSIGFKEAKRDHLFVQLGNDILENIIDKYKEDGKKEIIKMIDRGQISQETAENLLKDEYAKYASLVECVWDNPDESF